MSFNSLTKTEILFLLSDKQAVDIVKAQKDVDFFFLTRLIAFLRNVTEWLKVLVC